MPAHPPSPFARAGRLSISLVLGSATACSTWDTQASTPSEVLAVRPPSSARVTLAGGSTVEVHRPRIVGDTLTGWPDGGGHPGGTAHASDPADPIRIPLANIRSIAVRRVSAGKTALLVVGLGVTAAIVAAAASSDSPS